ncbi:clcC [Symbiodinium sp. CCMP2592]|nr:clcC [Symbiodinium sp. CCMP2592]
MPWRTPWLDESNLHHDTFLEQRAAHSPTASAIASRNNSPPNTPPLSRQGTRSSRQLTGVHGFGAASGNAGNAENRYRYEYNAEDAGGVMVDLRQICRCRQPETKTSEI